MVARGVWGRAWLAIAVSICMRGAFGQAEACRPWVAKVLSVQGPVEVERGGATPDGSAAAGRRQWRAVEGDETLCPGDLIRVGPLGRAAVQLADEVQTVLRLDERTTLSFPPREPKASPWLDLVQGVMHFITRVPRPLQIHTPFVNATVEGTELVLRVGEAETELIVFEGRVRFENAAGGLVVASQEAALARAGQRPVRRILVKPRKAVEWALYYPPLIDLQLIERGPDRDAAALREAASAYRRNDLAGAFTALDRVPRGARGGAYFLLRAGLLLSVGRVREAEAALADAEHTDPRSGGASALRSVIALVRDQKDEALRLAQAGAMLDPTSPLPESALSYAYQGHFEIERALEHARRAVDVSPEDALLWARVSELELSRSDLDAALEAAKKAEALNPTLARTQTVLGFAYLTRIEVKRAKETFEHAIRGDPADPLPRLGMGLAKIRGGDLEEGTREIETAASLDPNNALVRSYLGKAYFEEKRGGLASSEYEQAKLLDPKDPTPWFYDAIHKQTTNRPVEALHDLQKAIDLNDSRAVYRSKLLLDQDLAARSASLGRIYRDLGFEQLALVEGWKSVNTAPADYSGHRLLADSYSALPRHDIARVSELLQSQLLQPINITPVQPSLAESNLLILEGAGPSAPAFNEFSPLFTRNRLSLQTSAIGGSNNTFGDEVVQSGVWDNFSYSLGQFHYKTDGFRENNDLTQDIYNGFVQMNLTPKVSFQLEGRHRELEHGDILFRFRDPRFSRRPFSDTFRRELNVDTVRLGGHVSLTPASDVITSAIFQDTEERDSFTVQGYIAEAQYLFRAPFWNIVLGGGYYASDNTFPFQEFPECSKTTFVGTTFVDSVAAACNVNHGNSYAYFHMQYPSNLTWTLGLSYDRLDHELLGLHLEEINPKAGLSWDLTPNTVLRLAAFRALKRTLFSDQTLEPTQVGGFNQLYDDRNGTLFWRYGIALDQKFAPNLFAGLELSMRKLELPAPVLDDWEEDLYRGYIYWTPTQAWALNLSFEWEVFKNLGTELSPSQDQPGKLVPGTALSTETLYLPIALSYYHPSGLFGRLKATYANQTVTEVGNGDEFIIADTALGFRLPKRLGIITVEVRNIFDAQFNFEDAFDRSSTQDAVSLPFLPERTIFAQITLALP